jgi:flagellar P-ring protein precursor FlgI
LIYSLQSAIRSGYKILSICFFALISLNAIAQDYEGQSEDHIGVRIKDIARIHGIHDTQLHGYGLVVGLNGTGDSSGAQFTVQSVINMMRRFGIDVPNSRISLKNVAAVMVTADLPFFAKVGGRIDVLVSSIGDAKSIAGGTLLPTLLYTPDGQLHVIAQGPLSVGGFNLSAGGGNSIQKNHPTVGSIPNGGAVQKSPPPWVFSPNQPSPNPLAQLTIVLNEPDFTTVTRMASAINGEFSEMNDPIAHALDASSIKVMVPVSGEEFVAFVSRLENLMVVPDVQASVVIDERTGTVVVGKDVRITPVAVSHGDLNIQIKTEEEASQPPAFSAGETVILSGEDISAEEEKPEMRVLRGGASIDEVVRALNLIGVSPRNMIIILQAIKKAGALHAKLVIM